MLRLTFPEPYLDAFHVLICTWEKVYGINHTGFSKLLFNFSIFKSPSKLRSHTPAEDFPVQDKNQKTSATHSDNPRKKKHSALTLCKQRLINSNGILIVLGLNLKTQWKSKSLLLYLFQLLSLPLLNFQSKTHAITPVQYLPFPR